MLVPISTQNQPVVLTVGIQANRPVVIRLSGHDGQRKHSWYFRRKVPFTQAAIKAGKTYKEITLSMPLTPTTLLVEIKGSRAWEDEGFVIQKLEAKKMKPAEIWAQPSMHRFIDFAQQFAKRCGSYRPGYYDAQGHEFLIQLLPVIKDQLGRELVTPARTHRGTGRIQVAGQAFKRFTIPVRMFVLLHERQHFQIPTRDEKTADLTALQLYLDLGYPKIEAVYAATKVFASRPETVGKEHVKRAKDIISFIDHYRRANEVRLHQKATAI